MDPNLTLKFSLEGRRAVIVGAASGIGRQAAVTFAQAGAHLVLADIDFSGLVETRQIASQWSPDIAIHRLDVRDSAAVRAFGDEVDAGGLVDVWANVAGVISSFTVAEAREEEVARILNINLMGVYWCCSAAARILSMQSHGSIINISSAGADNPLAGLSAYSMSKAAVNMLTRILAHELGPHGIRVNAIAPGFIDTPMVTYRFRTSAGELDMGKRAALFEERARGTVLGCIGTPEDVAITMLYLASDASSFMTGQVLRPNGGMVMP
jgi:3-oxoacyl-[acyl-carrier protein] reductase